MSSRTVSIYYPFRKELTSPYLFYNVNIESFWIMWMVLEGFLKILSLFFELEAKCILGVFMSVKRERTYFYLFYIFL